MPAGRARGAPRRGGARRGARRLAARARARRPARRPPDRSDRLDVDGADRVAGVHRPSADARAPDDPGAGRTRARRLHRERDPGAPALPPRRARRRDGRERARAGFAAFNLALNGVTNVELREGSLLEPVAGERFGCIACNPPYVVSPDAEFTFRDSGLPGDRVSELLARGLPALLEPGGFATLMASWAQTGDDPGRAPARVARRLRLRLVDPAHDHRRSALERRRLDARRRRRAGGVRRRARPLDGVLPRARDRGARLRRARAATPRRRQLVARREPAAAAARARLEPSAADVRRRRRGGRPARTRCSPSRLAVAPAARFEQVVSPSEGWTVVGAALTLEEGLGFRADVDEPTLRLLRALDGTRTARDAVVASLGEEGAAARGRAPARDARDRLPLRSPE